MKMKGIAEVLFIVGVCVLSLFSTTRIVAAEKDSSGWRRSGIVTANLSQVNLTNWSSGGNNTVAFNAVFGYAASYMTEHTVWKTSIDALSLIHI